MKIVRDIVVIGAALGGLSAIAKIASTWPEGLPVSVLIALATPDQPAESVLQILDSYAPVRVTYAVNSEPIESGRIYVSPPGKHLSVGRLGVVRIDEPSFFDSVQPSVNRLFSAASVVFDPRVIGVVLSGHQYDGVQGMKDIEAAGGATIVQEPDDASAPLMPRHVLQNDHPRYRVKAHDIEPLIRRLAAGET
jgi:two-component system chemotaxis response regulator CheB